MLDTKYVTTKLTHSTDIQKLFKLRQAMSNKFSYEVKEGSLLFSFGNYISDEPYVFQLIVRMDAELIDLNMSNLVFQYWNGLITGYEMEK